MRTEPAKGQHVGIRPTAGLYEGGPFGNAVEFITKAEGELGGGRIVLEGPPIPVIVGDAPELRVFLHRDGVVELGWAGRKAEHDGSPGLADGLGDLANFSGAIRVVADAVDLDVIESPIGIELEHRVVIGLAGGVSLTPQLP